MSPTNLISALRLSLDLWKRENQVKNVQDIIKRGTLLYEKIAGFTDTFLRIGDNLSGLQRDYDKAYNQLSDGNGSVVRQAELLRNMSLTLKNEYQQDCCPKKRKRRRKKTDRTNRQSKLRYIKHENPKRPYPERWKMLPRRYTESR